MSKKDGKCTGCDGTGRDKFTNGALWCGGCGGSGKWKDQYNRALSHKRLDDALKKRWAKIDKDNAND